MYNHMQSLFSETWAFSPHSSQPESRPRSSTTTTSMAIQSFRSHEDMMQDIQSRNSASTVGSSKCSSWTPLKNDWEQTVYIWTTASAISRRTRRPGLLLQPSSERGTGELPPTIPSKTADMLIACDGINSRARSILYPNEGPPQFSGRILWRGCVERQPYLTGSSMVWGGHANQKFIAYPISARAQRKGKSLVNWICELRVRGENDPDTTPPKTDWLATVPKERFAPPI